MEIDQAERFLSLVEHASIARAAESMGIPAATLAQTLKKIEKSFGTLIFHRTSRALRLTPAGEALIEPARRLVRAKTVAHEVMSEVVRPFHGHVDVATVHMLNNALLPDIVVMMRHRYPHITIRIHEFETDSEAEQAVESGRVELGLTNADPMGEANSESLDICRHFAGGDELVLVVNEELAAALPKTITWSQVPDLPRILVPAGTHSRRAVDMALERVGIRSTTAVSTTHRAMVHSLIEGGIGIFWDSQRLVERSLFRHIRAVRLTPSVDMTWVVSHRQARLSPAARAMGSIVLENAADSRPNLAKLAGPDGCCWNFSDQHDSGRTAH